MRDLQRRLGAAGYLPPVGAEVGRYCARTQAAVASFQTARGLRATGWCDEHTWSVLVEAGWRLGDRLLHLRSPNLRGDDVVELQQLLNRLGFDCGRPDGIFGPLADRALREFQSNCGLHADGVCGVDTVQTLHGLVRQSGTGPGVAAVREVEQLRDARRGLDGRKLVVGQFGGMSTISRLLTKQLRIRGAHVVQADEPDAHAHAATANLFGADVYLGFEPSVEPQCTISYFAVPAFESLGGRALAQEIERVFVSVEELPPAEVVGMRLPVLRETRMPAVLCSMGPVRPIVDAAPEVARAVLDAVVTWCAAPFQPDPV